jgi:hypothetical protein
MAPTQESGLRENCTSRLSERAEAGRKPHLSRLYSWEADQALRSWTCSGSFRTKVRTSASVASVVPSFNVIGQASFADHRRLAFIDIGLSLAALGGRRSAIEFSVLAPEFMGRPAL